MTRAKLKFVLPIIALLCAIPAAVASSAVTIHQVLSAPFPSELKASPSGKHCAWVFNHRGVRNIWIAEGPNYEARQITRYTEDDGQEITGLQWAVDESAIVYVRGGAPNSRGELPNPLSIPEGVDRAILQVHLQDGEPIQLDDGNSPAVAPEGRRVAYLNKGEVKLLSLESDAEPETILKARGNIRSLRWSPDGSQLAFVSNRSDHSFVGVLDLETNAVTWMSPSLDRDSEPVWSPDGTSIAFIRLPTRSEVFIFAPYREGHPWAIHVADAVTGEGLEIWRAHEGRGSVFHGVVAPNALLWIDDNIVFPWERDGWTHLYSVQEEGGKARLLTPGDFEVEHVSLGVDGKTIYFSSNQDDIDRRHIWSVRVGKKPKAITKGNGIEWSPAPLANGNLAILASDAQMPAHAAIATTSGDVEYIAKETLPDDFPTAAMVEPQAVLITSADGLEIHGQLFLPSDLKAGERRPTAIFFHGGSRRQMLLGWHYGSYYHNAYGFNQYLASKGYVVLSVNYRSGIGYGMEFREAENYGATGGSEFNDVLGAGLYLKSRPDVDPDRIALWGGSYGGYLTAMGLARASDLFACGVDIHGVHDWNDYIHNFVPSYNPLENPERARIAFESSPLADVDNWRSPVLLITGDDDRNVNIHQSVRLIEALRERQVHVEQLVFPDEVHGFLLYSNWMKAFTAADDFLTRHMNR